MDEESTSVNILRRVATEVIDRGLGDFLQNFQLAQNYVEQAMQLYKAHVPPLLRASLRLRGTCL